VADQRESVHGFWKGRIAFFLAATGSAVGLGSIWKFPYITGENGGGAFVLVYLLCIAFVGIPVMMAEVLMGRRARQNPVTAVGTLARESGATTRWTGMGLLGIATSYLILTYYVVITGWAFAYIFHAGSGAFVAASPEKISADFGALLGNTPALLAWSTLMLLLTGATVMGGVQKGIERAVTILMPGLLVILLLLVGYCMAEGAFMEGVRFMFAPDFSKLTASGVLVALGHAFFTLSLASGVMVAYGAYVPAGTSIFKTTVAVVTADTVVSLLSGLAIFPLVFEYGLEPGAGPSLIFQTLPIAFGAMPYGTFFGTLFFVMLFVAAFGSAISLLEPTVATLVEQFKLTRTRAVVYSTGVAWIVSLPSVLSFNRWSGFHPVAGIPGFEDKTIFDTLDYLTANILLPISGLLIAIFCAWVMKAEATRDELGLGDGVVYRSWRFLMRYVVPISIVVVFLNLIGVLTF